MSVCVALSLILRFYESEIVSILVCRDSERASAKKDNNENWPEGFLLLLLKDDGSKFTSSRHEQHFCPVNAAAVATGQRRPSTQAVIHIALHSSGHLFIGADLPVCVVRLVFLFISLIT